VYPENVENHLIKVDQERGSKPMILSVSQKRSIPVLDSGSTLGSKPVK